MNSISFLPNAAIGFVISIITTALYLSLSITLDQYSAMAISCSVASFAYLSYLLLKSDSKFGRLSTLALFIITTVLLLMSAPSIVVIALTNALFIWLTRTFYFHKQFGLALADLILSLIAVTAAVAAASQSNSIFISIWSFFLAQSMILPSLNFCLSQIKRNGPDQLGQSSSQSRFQYAQRQAESALSRLAQQQ